MPRPRGGDAGAARRGPGRVTVPSPVLRVIGRGPPRRHPGALGGAKRRGTRGTSLRWQTLPAAAAPRRSPPPTGTKTVCRGRRESCSLSRPWGADAVTLKARCSPHACAHMRTQHPTHAHMHEHAQGRAQDDAAAMRPTGSNQAAILPSDELPRWVADPCSTIRRRRAKKRNHAAHLSPRRRAPSAHAHRSRPLCQSHAAAAQAARNAAATCRRTGRRTHARAPPACICQQREAAWRSPRSTPLSQGCISINSEVLPSMPRLWMKPPWGATTHDNATLMTCLP